MNRYIWHSWLGMPRESLDWYEADLKDELAELDEARGFVDRWSEKSDVVYTLTRARWNGYRLPQPLNLFDRVLGRIYMYPKYTLRFLFFRRAARKVNPKSDVREVKNPKKAAKIASVARAHALPEKQFVSVCRQQIRYWQYILPK